MLSHTRIYLGIIIVFTLLIRIPTLNLPINDSNNYRQGDNYAMIMNFYEGKTDVLHPIIYQANVPENTERYYLAEFPFYQFSIAMLFRLFGESLLLARLFSIFLTAITSCSIFLISRKYFDKRIGLASAIIFNLFPLSFFWGRSISPDVMGLAFFASSLAILLESKKSQFLFITSSFLFAGAVLSKPFYFAFIILHLWLLRKRLLAYYLLPIICFSSWRLWILGFPGYSREDPDFLRLMNGNLGYFQFFRDSNWTTLLFQRSLFGELLTPLGGILAIIGLTLVNLKNSRYKNFFNYFFLSSLSITLIVAWGTREHNYYFLNWLPLAAILVAYAFCEIFSKINSFPKLLFLVFVVFMFGALPFVFFAKNEFFANQAMYSSEFLHDYGKIRELTKDNDVILSIQSQNTPYPLNQIRRKGFVYEVLDTEDCPSSLKLNETVNNYIERGANLLMIQKNENKKYMPSCMRIQILKYFDNNPKIDLVYSGNNFNLYRIIDENLK